MRRVRSLTRPGVPTTCTEGLLLPELALLELQLQRRVMQPGAADRVQATTNAQPAHQDDNGHR